MVVENAAHRLTVAGFLMLASARRADGLCDRDTAIVLTELAEELVGNAAVLRRRAERPSVRKRWERWWPV
jgi:hypothetical protein